MKKLKRLILFLVISFGILFLLSNASWKLGFLKKVLFSYLEDTLQKEITADSLEVTLIRKIELNNLSISDKKGFSVSAREIKVDYKLVKFFSGGLVGQIKVEDIKFSKKGAGILSPILDLASVSYPSLSNMQFNNLSADIYIENKTIIPKNLKAEGDRIKIYGNGSVNSDGVIDYKLELLIASGKLDSAVAVLDMFRGLISDEYEKETKGVEDKEAISWVKLSFKIRGKKDNLLVSLF